LTDNYNQIVRDNEELGFFGVNILDEDILAKKKLGIGSNTTEPSSSQQDKDITKQITDQASDIQSNIDRITDNIDKAKLRGNYNKAFYATLNDYDTSPAMIIHDNEVSKLILALKNLKLEISKPEEIKLKQDILNKSKIVERNSLNKTPLSTSDSLNLKMMNKSSVLNQNYDFQNISS
jgi:hypothetical protein